VNSIHKPGDLYKNDFHISSIFLVLNHDFTSISQLQTWELMTSQIKSHIEYLLHTYNILKIDEKSSPTDAFNFSNTI